jgi:hypothetical protein
LAYSWRRENILVALMKKSSSINLSRRKYFLCYILEGRIWALSWKRKFHGRILFENYYYVCGEKNSIVIFMKKILLCFELIFTHKKESVTLFFWFDPLNYL